MNKISKSQVANFFTFTNKTNCVTNCNEYSKNHIVQSCVYDMFMIMGNKPYKPSLRQKDEMNAPKPLKGERKIERRSRKCRSSGSFMKPQ